MAEQKQMPKWILGVWIFLAVWGLVYVFTEEGWRRWLGVGMFVSGVGAAIEHFRKLKKGSST